MRNTYSILVRNAEGKRPLGRPRRRWKDNTRMDLREIGWEVVDRLRIGTKWRAVVNTVMNCWVP